MRESITQKKNKKRLILHISELFISCSDHKLIIKKIMKTKQVELKHKQTPSADPLPMPCPHPPKTTRSCKYQNALRMQHFLLLLHPCASNQPSPTPCSCLRGPGFKRCCPFWKSPSRPRHQTSRDQNPVLARPTWYLLLLPPSPCL